MEFDFSLKAPQPKCLSECHQLIEVLWATCQLQQETLNKLKEQVKTYSGNSSSPPSTDSPRARAIRTARSSADWRKRTPHYWQKRRQGAQKGHKGHGRQLWSQDLVDEIIPCYPASVCSHCRGLVHAVKLQQRKQVFDIQIGKLQVIEYQIYGGKCRSFKKSRRGDLPAGVPTGILGAQTLARIGTLSGKYRLSKREIKAFFEDFFGLNISIGTVSNAESIINQALEKPIEEVRQAIQEQAYLHVDETSHYHQWKLAWLWVARTQTLTYFKIFAHRNQASAQTLIGQDFAGILISDRYGAYNWLISKQRQYCWAHLKRDFQKIADGAEIKACQLGFRLLSIYRTLFKAWHQIQTGCAKKYHRAALLNAIKALRRCLREGQKRLPHTKTGTFCKKLIKEWGSLWHFLRYPYVAQTNNQAVRQLRHGIIWRKKCLGTRSERGNQFVERILTSVMTCKQRKRPVIHFVTDCVTAFWLTSKYP